MRIITGLFLICLAMLVAGGGLVLVQRLMPTRRRMPHNDVAGFIYAVLGVVYAVLLGLMVVAVWEDCNAANAAVDQEASELAEVFWLAHRLPQPEGPHLQELARSYAQVVVNEEWPLLPFSDSLSRRILGSTHKSQPVLSRFSVRSHTSLLVILVIRTRPDTAEGDHIGAATE